MQRPFRVYRNIHRGNFSIKSYVHGKYGYRVTDRGETFLMKECGFKIYEAGRQRVLKEQVKNVHAFVESTSYEHLEEKMDVSKLREIYYNPYKHDSFVYKDTLEKVEKVAMLLAQDNKLYDVE
jgi:hypothetical protein